jgi:hypothetical protein
MSLIGGKVIINGGGIDSLTLNTQGELNYTIKNRSSNVLFNMGTGGTVITVINLGTITVLDENGYIVFTGTAP